MQGEAQFYPPLSELTKKKTTNARKREEQRQGHKGEWEPSTAHKSRSLTMYPPNTTSYRPARARAT